jgi:hypothetical protein
LKNGVLWVNEIRLGVSKRGVIIFVCVQNAGVGERSGVYRVLVGKPGGKRPLGRPWRRWDYNIKMDIREVGCGGMDWIGLAQDRDRWRELVNAVMNRRFP